MDGEKPSEQSEQIVNPIAVQAEQAAAKQTPAQTVTNTPSEGGDSINYQKVRDAEAAREAGFDPNLVTARYPGRGEYRKNK